MNIVPISVVILTYNEEANIEYALKSVCGWASEIFVVDSYSTDTTLEKVRNYTDNICQHPFSHCADQRNWALQNLPLSQDWILFLDADEEVTPQLQGELCATITRVDQDTAAFSLRHEFFFLDEPLRHAHFSIPHIRVIRINRAFWQRGEGTNEQCVVKGKIEVLQSKLLHNNRKKLSDWIRKHDWYATESASCFLERKSHHQAKGPTEAIEEKLPLILHPFARFFYAYFLRLGFLDGKAGFAYAFLHDFWFPFLVYLKVQEMRK